MAAMCALRFSRGKFSHSLQDAEAAGKEGTGADAAAGGRLALKGGDNTAALLVQHLLTAMAAGGPSGALSTHHDYILSSL